MSDQPTESSEESSGGTSAGGNNGADVPSFEQIDRDIDKARHALQDVEGETGGRTFMGDGPEHDEGRPSADKAKTDDTIVPPG